MVIKVVKGSEGKLEVIFKYCFKTQKAYAGHIRRLMEFYGKDPFDLHKSYIQQYILKLMDIDNVSTPYIHQFIGSIKYFYTEVLNKKAITKEITYPKRNKNCPLY